MPRMIASTLDVFRVRALRQRPPYEEVWHLWSVLIPRRSITGPRYGVRSAPRTWAVDLGNTSETSTDSQPPEHRLHQALKSPKIKAPRCPLAGVAVLVALSADVGKMHIGSPGTIATAAAVTTPSRPSSRAGCCSSGPPSRRQRGGFVIVEDRWACRVGILMSRGSRLILTIWKTITARVLFMGGIGPAAARRRASIRAEKPSTSASCGWRELIAASCQGARARSIAAARLFRRRWCNSTGRAGGVTRPAVITAICGKQDGAEAWAQ